ncbi:hypothetical protein DTO169C6_2182 [Paecilomyces variotii]|nr:hypothetical protein DTO169C6_2182 [Paecilomyces variotii]
MNSEQSFLGALEYLINHVFLPPNVPQQDDYDSDHEHILLKIVSNALLGFKSHVADEWHNVIDSIIGMVENLQKVLGSDGLINKAHLLDTLKKLSVEGGTLLLHIREQNCGVMMTKTDGSILIEAFELSPSNNSVTSTLGRLRRLFPGPALAMKIGDFETDDLQEVIAETLAKMSSQPAPSTKPKVKKANHLHDEDRDSTHPKLVTELFFNFLRPVCDDAEPSRIWKNTREEVMWRNSRLPWRRSPLWLLVRVGMQLVMGRYRPLNTSIDDLYKHFMIYLLTRVLRLCCRPEVPCDIIYAMQAKISRRLLKLHTVHFTTGLALVREIMQQTTAHLTARWSVVQNRENLDFSLLDLERLEFEEDTLHNLASLDDFLYKKSLRQENTNQQTSFRPSSGFKKLQTTELPGVDTSETQYTISNLHAFETWIDMNLDAWMEKHRNSLDTCEKLSSILRTYHTFAAPRYNSNPEATSVMLLTILELWVSCDQNVLRIDETMSDYDIGIPTELFQCFVLRSKSQMERLHRIECYIDSRRKKARFPVSVALGGFGHRNSFCVRYFNRSAEHQELLARIESQATDIRNRKRKELHDKKQQYEDLMRNYETGVCDMVDDDEFDEPRHSNYCRKCQYRTQARSIDIDVHEWPLPANRLELQSTVVELQLPRWYGFWRDTAVYLLSDVLGMRYSAEERPRAEYRLSTYSGLQAYFQPYCSGYRLGLLSQDKPHGNTHRKKKLIVAVTEDDVCLENALHYHYYDSQVGVFSSPFQISPQHIPDSCMYLLPDQSSFLQQHLRRPAASPNGPSPNSVIANQDDCPPHISINEYKELAQMPLGCRIQWLNILTQLTMPSIDFKKVETTIFILQMIHQTGPRDKDYFRQSHSILQDEIFCQKALESIKVLIRNFKRNWDCVQSLHSVTALVVRILSLTSSESIQSTCQRHLCLIRRIACSWIQTLKQRGDRSTVDHHRQEFQEKAVLVALVCTSSFDMDDKHLRSTLRQKEESSILIQTSIIIEEGHNLISNSLDPLASILHTNWKRVLYRAYPVMLEQIVDVTIPALDDAIQKSWCAYRPGSKWRRYSDQEDHWLCATTATETESTRVDALPVQYNLLTGELFVNGHRLSRLPSEYEQHSSYLALFGRACLEIMPSDIPGMRFSSKRRYAGYTVHLNLEQQTQDLRIRAINEHSTLEFVPSRLLQDKFPQDFVQNFIHWYDVEKDRLEFRPRDGAWDSSSNSWFLVRSKENYMWHLVKGDSSLISVASKTGKMISKILAPLEVWGGIHMIFHPSESLLLIDLPRLQLSFNLGQGAHLLQSPQFRGFCVDRDQSLGCLVGFKNKLVLKHQENGSRMAILLEGDLSHCKSLDHIHVSADQTSNIKAHVYVVDDQIGRLVDNSTLQSKLLLCYLHALTGFCLPDPLTGKTGTEQALSILRSSAVHSFDPLTTDNVQLLAKIAHLTPKRTYYPAHLKEMQSVEWTPKLSFLAQHDSFYKEVKGLLDEKSQRRFLWPRLSRDSLNLDSLETELLTRAMIRSSVLRVSGYGAEDHTDSQDCVYASRDRSQGSASGYRAFTSSNAIHNGNGGFGFSPVSWNRKHLWKFLSKASPLHGSHDAFPLRKFRYDSEYLLESDQSVSKNWISLHSILGRRDVNKFRVMIWLSTLGFAENADVLVLQALICFYTLGSLSTMQIPTATSFALSEGLELKRGTVQYLVKDSLHELCDTPEINLVRGFGESKKQFRSRRHRSLVQNQEKAVKAFTDILMGMWPCRAPTSPADTDPFIFGHYIKVETAMKPIREAFAACFDNRRFYDYLGEIVKSGAMMDGLWSCCDPIPSPWCSWLEPRWTPQANRGYVSISDIFTFQAPLPSMYQGMDTNELLRLDSQRNNPTPRLSEVVENLDRLSVSSYERTYVERLRVSLQQFLVNPLNKRWKLKDSNLAGIIYQHRDCRKQHLDSIYTAFLSAVNITTTAVPESEVLKILADAQCWPRLSPAFFLEQLSRSRWNLISNLWKQTIVSYGVAFTELQRAQRMVDSVNNPNSLVKELQNPGHTNWDPYDYPDSLLLEVESGLMIREVQEDIAREMTRTSENAVLQLNMGEGKSAVIVPKTAITLADGTRLVRVMVPKPQARQMFQMLISKLGGMVGRRIYHLPFSRALHVDDEQAEEIVRMCRQCMEQGGILLVQPEQILSLKLMGLECLVTGRTAVGRSLLDAQAFFDQYSRDIVDESDENFSTKFELVYTMGDQRPVDLSPQRWILIQEVLSLVKKRSHDVKKNFPLLEIGETKGGNFPRIRIFDVDMQRELCALVANDICETGLKGFPVARQCQAVRDAVRTYITQWELTSDQVRQVEGFKGGFWSDSTRDVLFLLRGLLAGGIIAFVFGQKRWRVNYGLTTARDPPTKLAVPYRAKDSPTLRSEFSHPEVVIILTSLSYYYGGLDNEDLFIAFRHLLNADQADVEYQIWVREAQDLPREFEQLVSINLEDYYQCVEDVFPCFRFAKSVIDYFLSQVIFPKEVKEFPQKLSASGWDIGQPKRYPTTGFSGTNDSRETLPVGVKQLDLPGQVHTNALVLEHILQPENSVVTIPPRDKSSKSDAEVLLSLVMEMDPPAQVILDVGAQVLELNNLQVATEWLRLTSGSGGPQAVVFCDDNDDLCVVDRKGHVELLQTSPFSKQLGVCYVFLDESHTRGIDLKLPLHYRAAVTLGASLTKDRLAQACMRMRELGRGQSAVFCVPPEIQHKIRAMDTKSKSSHITVSDVLTWAVSETWIDTTKSVPLWYTQGQRFAKQTTLWDESRTDEAIDMSAEQATDFLEEEAQSLEQRYKPFEGHDILPQPMEIRDGLDPDIMTRIMERYRGFGDVLSSTMRMDEEQERELSPEIQRQRQVQRPLKAQPAEHFVHPDIRKFISTGIVPEGSIAFRPAFRSLAKSSAAEFLDVTEFPKDLLVTTDFAYTIMPHDRSSFISDAYQRPVQWILTSRSRRDGHTGVPTTQMVIISPYEAQELYPSIKHSKYVALHLYAPRSNLGLQSLDHLDLYSIPQHAPEIPSYLTRQLNLFSGQLYLRSFAEYVELCSFLGLTSKPIVSDDIEVAADGFILRREGRGRPTSNFSRSPVKFLQVLLSQIRRSGEGIDKTHMGKILDGIILHPSDFDIPDEGHTSC